jgi:glycosyltransferase involved in cell wall biosynthesis
MTPTLETDLSVIVPAYNEAERLPRTLKRLQEHLDSKPLSYEIIVVLDGPTDSSREVLKNLTSEISHLTVLDRRVHRGKGFTVREGMLKASGRVRLFTDADNSTDISHLEKMVPLFEQGCDVAICSRAARDAAGARQVVPQAWYRRVLGKLGNLFIQLVAVKGIWDTMCGFKAFRDHAAERIFSQAVIDGWGFDVEALALARALKYRIGVVPAYWINQPKSHVTSSSYLQVCLETVRVRYRLCKGKYKL